MEATELPEPPKEERAEDSAGTAYSLSYSSTLKYPGCAAAEGVEIARLCKKLGKDPIELKAALLQDEDKIQKLISKGNVHHEENKVDREVGRPRMIAMIEATFNTAAAVLSNTTEELEEALDLYPRYKFKKRYDEKGYEDVMRGLSVARSQRVNEKRSTGKESTIVNRMISRPKK